MGEDRFGNDDLVILGKATDDPDRSILDQRQAGAELRTSPRLDPFDQEAKDILEQPDLIFAEAIGAGEKKGEQLSQRCKAKTEGNTTAAG